MREGDLLSTSEVVVVGSFDYCRGWRCRQQTCSGGRSDLVGAGVTFSKYNEKDGIVNCS